MSILNNYILDYEFIHGYSIEQLRQELLLPLKKDEYFTYVLSCSESSEYFCCFDDNEMVKTIISIESEILFCLSDFETKLSLYRLSKKAMNKDDDNTYIEEFLDELLEYALLKKCSDIHFETSFESLIIRFRIDGVLKIFFNFDKQLYYMLSSIIKLVSKLDITERRRPQDGRFSISMGNKEIDFRVSTMPTINGESIVLRILDQYHTQPQISNLGFDSIHFEKLKESIKKSNGLILVTGPTGSGKSTTLYSILKELNQNDRKIITIEDPVEYQLKGVQQIAVNQEIGLTFNEVLKNVLRQDPDIIMIGEIRDKESLSIALQASLTGHLVLSTLHTNDSISTLNRLYDLDAKPFLIASTLRAIISQRLVAKCCCLTGCNECNFTKFSGRISLFEFLEVDEHVSSMIHQKKNQEEILKYLKDHGFKTLLEDATEKINQGLTTYKEVYKVVY
jgi:general secretion pathway protein E